MELPDEKERRINRNYSRLVFDVISVQSAIALSRNIHIYSAWYILVCIPGRRIKILTHIQAERVSCNVTSSSPRSFAQALDSLIIEKVEHVIETYIYTYINIHIPMIN